jgi:hypothetical protein
VHENSFERTAQFSSSERSETPVSSPKSGGVNKWILIAASVLVLTAGGITTYKLVWDKDGDGGKTTVIEGGQVYTIDDLKPLNYEKLEKLANDQVDVTAQDGDTINIDEKTYVLTVEDGKLTKVEEKKVVGGDPPPPPPPVFKDSDGDGVSDSKDPCPNDKLNKCKKNTPIPPSPAPGPAKPKDVASFGNNTYGIEPLAGGEVVRAIYKRIANRQDIKDIGVNKKVSTLSEICAINNVKEGDTIRIKNNKKVWIKFKVN